MIKVFLVDDEPPARARLRQLLVEAGDVRVVGESGNGEDARDAIIAARIRERLSSQSGLEREMIAASAAQARLETMARREEGTAANVISDVNRARDHRAGAPPADDVTVMVIKRDA